jgi:hypothetical protein
MVPGLLRPPYERSLSNARTDRAHRGNRRWVYGGGIAQVFAMAGLDVVICVEEGVATPQDVDTIVRTTFGYRLPVPMEFGLINYRAAISQALDLGCFRGAFLFEHYGSDAITVIRKNRAYIRDILGALID